MNWIVASEQIPDVLGGWMTSMHMSPDLFMLVVTSCF